MVVLVILVTGCSQPSPAAGATPTVVAATCRLPITIQSSNGVQGAFLSFPSGEVTIDPHGAEGVFYDRPLARWLTARRQAVSVDGARYASVEFKVPGTAGQSRLHVVDLATSHDQVFLLGLASDLNAYTIVDFAADGIWLAYSGYEGPSFGLFFFDPATGLLEDMGLASGLAGLADPVAGGPGVFWFTDPGPKPQGSEGMGELLQSGVQRVTIGNGHREVWFTKPGYYVGVIGTDSMGHPIIHSYSKDGADESVRLLMSPTESKVIGVPPGSYEVSSDSHGSWFGGNAGIYLYTQAGVVQKVSSQAGIPSGTCS